jgi:hypothetical protein
MPPISARAHARLAHFQKSDIYLLYRWSQAEGEIMTLPESLPARLYLLAYDTEKNRVTAQSQLGLVLRGAALADLYLTGRVTDENGKARAAGGVADHRFHDHVRKTHL